MKIYHVKRTDKVGYDEYDSCPKQARNMYPDESPEYTWVTEKLQDLEVTLIGYTEKYKEPCVILGSFNAG
jgi:hypothetical protein